MCPARTMARPTSGILASSCFPTKRTEPGSVAASAQMPNIDQWLEAYTTGPSRGRRNRSNPPAPTAAPAPPRALVHAQQRGHDHGGRVHEARDQEEGVKAEGGDHRPEK